MFEPFFAWDYATTGPGKVKKDKVTDEDLVDNTGDTIAIAEEMALAPV